MLPLVLTVLALAASGSAVQADETGGADPAVAAEAPAADVGAGTDVAPAGQPAAPESAGTEAGEADRPPSSTASPAAADDAPPATAVQDAPAPGLALGRVLRSGASGSDVADIQNRLAALGYDPGPADGNFGQATTYAVYALQKVHGLSPTGAVGDAEAQALDAPYTPSARRPDLGPDHVEVDLARQLMYVFRGGGLALITHVSTGNGERYCVGDDCRVADTPVGDFTFLWAVNGWESGPLGDLYNPVYLTDFGTAVHGSTSVPLYPASHGCIRIPLNTADRFPGMVSIGEPITIFEG